MRSNSKMRLAAGSLAAACLLLAGLFERTNQQEVANRTLWWIQARALLDGLRPNYLAATLSKEERQCFEEDKPKEFCRKPNTYFTGAVMRAKCNVNWLTVATRNPNEQRLAQLTKQKCEYTLIDRFNSSGLADDWLERDPVGSLMPVTSLANNVTYLNLHCARCNFQAAKLDLWKPTISCNQVGSALNDTDRVNLRDCVESKQGLDVLRYSSLRRAWYLNVELVKFGEGAERVGEWREANFAPSAEVPDELLCTIESKLPRRIQHLIWKCSLGWDYKNSYSCLEESAARFNKTEWKRLKSECTYKTGSLVYSRAYNLLWENWSCAKCDPNLNRISYCNLEPIKYPNYDGLYDLDLSPEPPEPMLYSVSQDHQGALVITVDYSGGGKSNGGYNSEVGSTRVCAEDQVFNKFSASCQPRCGLTRRALNNRCVRLE